ncbi:MAG: hypothetical protein AB8B94_09490 [Hyphomicrobiales bacterium]
MTIVFGSNNLDIFTRVPRLPGPGETVKGHGRRSGRYLVLAKTGTKI